MRIFSTINAAASGLTAQRLRMDTISNNIANVNTTRTDEGGPYKRQVPVFAPRQDMKFNMPFPPRKLQDQVGEGVRILGIKEDNSKFRMVYEPGHPDANKEGYVAYPNVSIVKEMVDMISANRSYEANVSVISTAKGMAQKSLTIGRA
ncbi:MAG: flagellar basal body rod protein FlgC [Candidatus Muiribacterium halophilum]|uniref:Flagellar basal-body rod protein FlgC n=1 Tax=Muiribacterium halophilum TaxID=2053465 RepID=A0A2N5ZJW9_MUIH1|nr:MAG: flagellar basal body rod protein FlgC [Candidatus Muirbacterium halophilum]